MKTVAITIIITTAIIGGVILLAGKNKSSNNIGVPNGNNVNVVDGKQTITINAKGGYSPRVTTAQAGMPTVLKMNTQGTFDCSSALTIPILDYRNHLPPSGETLIDVPPQKAGTTMRGLCAMGMYNFTVTFN